MRIAEAAARVGMSPRMLRYRDRLGLLPPVRDASGRTSATGQGGVARPPASHGDGPPASHGDGRDAAAGPAPRRPAAGPPASPGRLTPAGADGAGRPHPVRADTEGAVPGPAAPRGLPAGAAHRRFDAHDLGAVALGLAIERRYDISPAALAFGLRVLTEPGVRAEVAELGRRIGRIGSPPARALEFEKERALRLLNLAPGRAAEPDRPLNRTGR